MSAIWRDIIYTSTASTLSYQIKSGSKVLYTGKATKMPDEDSCIINVNQICKNYMSETMPDIHNIQSEVVSHPEASVTFSIYEGNTLLGEYDFIWDWSYERDGDDNMLSCPINGKADPRMKLLFTAYSSSGTSYNIEISGGSSEVEPNKIYYTTISGEICTPNANAFDATIISNVYEGDKGVITFDDTVTVIGERAFYDKIDLKTIEYSSSVVEIGDWAFASCRNLRKFVILDSVTTIGDYTFDALGPRYETIYFSIGSGVTNVGLLPWGFAPYYFYTDSVFVIGQYFSELETVVIGNHITEIPDKAFSLCPITGLTIGNNVTRIGEQAFTYNHLTDLVIPDSVEIIDYSAFFRSVELRHLLIGNHVRIINSSAFELSENLVDLVLPASVTRIGNLAFGSCHKLKTITCLGTIPPTLVNFPFYDSNAIEAIYVPAESVQTYKSAPGWSDYENKIQAIVE